MAKFANAKTQAGSVAKQLQVSIVRSVGSVGNYEDALKSVAQYCKDNRITLRELTPEGAITYLECRSEEVGQSALNKERQAIEKMMWQCHSSP